MCVLTVGVFILLQRVGPVCVSVVRIFVLLPGVRPVFISVVRVFGLLQGAGSLCFCDRAIWPTARDWTSVCFHCRM